MLKGDVMLEAEVYSCESSPEYMDFDLEDLIYSVEDLSLMEELFQLGFVSDTKVFSPDGKWVRIHFGITPSGRLYLRAKKGRLTPDVFR